jgi:hypothetical protein
MSADRTLTPRPLDASEYVRELFGPADNVAILVRNRSTGHTVQTIAKAEALAFNIGWRIRTLPVPTYTWE